LFCTERIIEAAMKNRDWKTHELFERIYSEEDKHLFRFQEYVDFKGESLGTEESVSEWRKIFTEDYFELLNKAAAGEISAILQYTNQHEKANLLALRTKNLPTEVITEKNKSSVVSELLKEIFMQEMEHLEKISERIYLLEGETKPRRIRFRKLERLLRTSLGLATRRRTMRSFYTGR